MAESVPPQQNVSENTSTTITIASTDTQDGDEPTLRLRLKKPKSDKKVQWTSETVDNEEMNKKKSKCCCIFKKPKQFDESSSDESDDECEHCHGHVEKKKQKKLATVETQAITLEVDCPEHNGEPDSNPELTPSE